MARVRNQPVRALFLELFEITGYLVPSGSCTLVERGG